VTPREVVLAWADALNGRDLDGMLALVTEDFQLETMHRGTLGREAIPAFLERQTYGVGMHVVVERFVDDGDRLVAGGTGEWRRVETGEVEGSGESALSFSFRDGLIARAKVHPNMEAALDSDG
jgi:hypothetical protein